MSGTFWQATQPVSAAALPLPSGAAQDSTLTGGSAKFKLLDSGGANVASVSSGGALKVDGSSATQPVSGTFWQATQPVSGTFWQATQPVSASSWPLPTGAAQEHTSAGSPSSARLTDGTSFYIGSQYGQLPTSLTGSGNLKVAILEGGGGVVGAVTQSGSWVVALTATGAPQTYRAATGLFTPATSATDMAGIFWNTSSGKTIRVLAIYLNYKAAAQSAANDFYLIKRSTLNSGGSPITGVTHDYNNYSNAAPTALVKYWTTNPVTPGTTIGTMEIVTLTPYSSVNANPPSRKQVLYEVEPGAQGIVLRQGGGSGTPQEGLVINNASATVANASAQVGFTFVWTEE